MDDVTASAPTRPARGTSPRKRRSPGWVPNQHGAWAMLATPLVAGTIAGAVDGSGLDLRRGAALIALTALWFIGYFAFFATGLWLKARRKPRYWPPVRAYAIGVVIAGAATLALAPDLIVWSPLFVIPMGVGLYASATRDERSLWSGLTTTVGSCLMTLVAYDAAGGTDWTRAWILAGVLALYFAGTVLYVKTMIRERDNPRALAASIAWHAVATALMIPISWPLATIFAILTARAAIVPRYPLSPKQVGIGEIAATVAVGVAALIA